ncbi:unnamed protein product [Effrenium voratum]|nr:unnamed protein product [Effrenium voratum]
MEDTSRRAGTGALGSSPSRDAMPFPESRFWPKPAKPLEEPGDGHSVLQTFAALDQSEEWPDEEDERAPSGYSFMRGGGCGGMFSGPWWPLSRSQPNSAVRRAHHVPGERPTWHAVWCHERSHKTDASATRAQLQAVIARCGGELVCHKTAVKLRNWLDDNTTGRFLLVSDWRQLKPCLDHFAVTQPLPQAVILLCETAKICAKAHQWNEGRAATPFPLYIMMLEDDWTSRLSYVCETIMASSVSGASLGDHPSSAGQMENRASLETPMPTPLVAPSPVPTPVAWFGRTTRFSL